MCCVSFSFSAVGLNNSTLTRILGGLNGRIPAVGSDRCFTSTFGTMRSTVRGKLILTKRSVSTNNVVATLLRVYFTGIRNNLRIGLSGLSRRSVIGVLFTRGPNVLIRIGSGGTFRGLVRSTKMNFTVVTGPASRHRVLISGRNIRCRFNVSCVHSM